MVTTLSTLRYFQPAEPKDADWHAYREDSPNALCGMIALRYNVDSIQDALPGGAKLHGPCADKLRSQEDGTEAASEPGEMTGEMTEDEATGTEETPTGEETPVDEETGETSATPDNEPS
jgi:hypothetical protein